MQLSEAILAGSKLAPQAFGTLYDAQGGTCALGAAAVIVALEPEPVDGGLKETFPILMETVDELPCGCPGGVPLVDAIVHLNDKHHWPREVIAKWVRSLERK